MAAAPPVIRLATPAEVIPLRCAVLRPSQPVRSSHYPADNDPTTRHVGAFTPDDGRCVAAASIFRESHGGADAYRLRGMAVDPAWRGTGLGRKVLDQIIAEAAAANVRTLWCNARLSAVGFYARMGWSVDGPQFDIPDAGGAHHRMVLRLP